MKKVLLIDGNSIMNRAFYGIMGSKILTNSDGKYTNALYGFLAILFKNLEEVSPDYMLIAFDSKTAANVRKQVYDGYKKNRHKMPDELAEQMGEIKEILDAMNIKHLELSDYEGDDILGSFSKKFADENTEVYILSGDRDLFQLAQKNIIIRIPRTKMGKTETEIYDEQKIEEEYGLKPCELIELKALMGDSSDEIPGAPGIGPKTATTLLQKFSTIDKLYDALDNEKYNSDFKPKVRESLENNKELVYISKDIGTIKIDAPITDNIEDIRVSEWDNDKVYDLFKYYGFNKYIERFNLSDKIGKIEEKETNIKEEDFLIENRRNLNEIKIENKLFYYFDKEKDDDDSKIIKKKIVGIGVLEENKTVYVANPSIEDLKNIFEDENVEKIGFNISEDYVMLKELGISMKNIKFDVEVAAYDIDPTNIKHKLSEIAMQYLNIDVTKYISEKQINLFSQPDEDKKEIAVYVYVIKKMYEIGIERLTKDHSIKLFEQIEMPLITVLSEMQFNGMKADREELIEFGKTLKARIDELSKEIHELAGEEFNINSTQQLGIVLFEKLGLPTPKKTKKGYSTDVDTLEKIKNLHPVVNKILEYRTISKLNSTYVEGLIPYINNKTGRINSYFHQTITATGRISSTEPNLQNIPSHDELGRNIKKAFKAEEGYVYIDADYSQIELRVLAHMAHDENMLNAFRNDEDIHREVASRVFDIPFDEVTKEQRSRAKAVNFGIVYGITGFGLAQQIGCGRKEADNYIESYLEKYSGIKDYMNRVVENAKQTGWVETLFGRRRYIHELKSSNYMVREFGKRAAMNTPIQGTAADIMKIAMNNVYKTIEKSKINAKIVLQVHDELLLEVEEKDKEKAKEILKTNMENAVKLDVPLKVEISEAKTWYDAK